MTLPPHTCLSLVQAATDLDTVIAAHNQYLETLLKKALLDDNVADRPGAAAQNGLQGHLHMILRHMLNLMGPVARLNEVVRDVLAQNAGMQVSQHCCLAWCESQCGCWSLSHNCRTYSCCVHAHINCKCLSLLGPTSLKCIYT